MQEEQFMNNEAIDILSFFQVRRSSDDRLWLYREADIMNNDIYFPFYANQSNSFDNRKSFYLENQYDYPEDFIGVWKWSATRNRNNPSNDYITLNYVNEISGIEVSYYKEFKTMDELINTINEGIELTFESDQALLAVRKGKEYEGLLVNYDDFDKLSNGLYMIKKNITKRPVYIFNDNSTRTIGGVPFYKSINMDIDVARYELMKQPYDIVKNLFLDRISWSALKNEGYTRDNYRKIKDFISNMNSKSLIDDVQNTIKDISYDDAERYVNYFIKNIERYIDCDSIEDNVLSDFIVRNKKMFEICMSKVEEEWKKENQKRINNLEEYSKQRTLEIEEELKDEKKKVESSLEETRQQTKKLEKRNNKLQEEYQELQNEYKQVNILLENTRSEIKDLELAKEEMNHIDEDIDNKIKNRILESKKDLASFVSEYTFLNALIPTSQTVQVESQIKSNDVSSFIPYIKLDEDETFDNENWQDTFELIQDVLKDNGITKQSQSFAAIIYACYWKKFPVLFAGPYGELLANIISMAITGQGASVLDCSGDVTIQDIQHAKEVEILLVKNCFCSSKKDYIIDSLSNQKNFVIFTLPFSDELKIESKELMNYMLPIFTENLFEELPVNSYMKGNRIDGYEEFTPRNSTFRLSKVIYKDTQLSKLRRSLYSEILDKANQISQHPSPDMEYFFILYPMIFMDDAEEKYIEVISTNNNISKDMKNLLLSKLGDEQ